MTLWKGFFFPLMRKYFSCLVDLKAQVTHPDWLKLILFFFLKDGFSLRFCPAQDLISQSTKTACADPLGSGQSGPPRSNLTSLHFIQCKQAPYEFTLCDCLTTDSVTEKKAFPSQTLV